MKSNTGSRVRIGISACLLGEEVRYDGGHKRDPFLTDVLGPHVTWVPVCPEVELGLGTPRETLRLVRSGRELRMITTRTGVDLTKAMDRWSCKRVEDLAAEDLCGYVLKKDSPSCGMEAVKVYGRAAVPERTGTGLFARALLNRFPSLPVEEEGRLLDPALRESFIERVFAYRRLKDLFVPGWSAAALIRFHSTHKLALLAHSTAAYRELRRLVAEVRRIPRRAFRERYEQRFMAALGLPATTRRHTNVLLHMTRHLEGCLDQVSKGELLRSIDEYRREQVPLLVPLTLIRHHARAHNIEYLKGQTYLEPDPRELLLRNHG